MSKALQWVIGIGVVLVVAAIVFSSVAPFFLPRTSAARAPLSGRPNRPMGPLLPFIQRFLPSPGRVGPGGIPFFGLFGLAACAWPLLIIGLVVWALVTLNRPRPQPPLTTPAPMAVVSPAPVSQAVCSQCGQPLQAGWRHCPNCGRPVA